MFIIIICMIKKILFMKNLFYKVFDFAFISSNAILLCVSIFGFIYSLYTGDRCSGKLCNFTHYNLTIYIVYHVAILMFIGGFFIYGLRKTRCGVWYSRIFIAFPFLYPIINFAKDILIEHFSVPSYYL